MTAVNTSRGEVALPFGDGSLTLRISYGALGKMLPLLLDVSPELAENRRRWFARSQERIPEADPPPVEWMEWHHHLLGALAAAEVDTVARCVAIMAEEYHPGTTAEQVMAQSPSWGMTWRAVDGAIRLFHWRPGEEPEVAAQPGAPFALARRLLALLPSRLRTASASPSSGR